MVHFKKSHICFYFVCWKHNDLYILFVPYKPTFFISGWHFFTWWFSVIHGVTRFCTATHQHLQNPLCNADAILSSWVVGCSKKCHFWFFICGPSTAVWEHLSPLSNGESLWIQTVKINLSGWDPGTKNKAVHLWVKKQTSLMYQYTNFTKQTFKWFNTHFICVSHVILRGKLEWNVHRKKCA